MHDTDVKLKEHSFRVFLVIALLTLVTYAVIFTISPLNGEDFGLTKHMAGESFENRFAFIVYKSSTQIALWNARLGEQLAIFWLSWPRLYFTLAAVVTFTLFNYLLATTASDGTRRVEKTAISMAAIFALWPGMELFFWSTANAGYLQPLVLFLVCIYFYRNEQAVSQLNRSSKRVYFVCVAAFFAGLSFETVPIAVLAYLALTVFFCKEKLITVRTIAPLIAMATGWALLIAAPSTFIRRAYYANVYKKEGYSVEYLLMRATDVLEVFQRTTQPLLIVYVVASLYLARRRQLWKPLFFLFVTAFLTVFSISAAPYTEPRAFSLAWALMYSVVLAAVFEVIAKYKSARLFLVLILAGLLYFPFATYSMYSQFSNEMNARDAMIRSRVSAGECQQGITVKAVTTPYTYRYLVNRDEWYKSSANQVSIYYNCKVVVE